MDAVRAGPFGQLFRPDNFVFGQSGAGKLEQKEGDNDQEITTNRKQLGQGSLHRRCRAC